MRGEVQVDSTDGILLEPVLMDLTASQSTAFSGARSSPLLRKCASLGRSPAPVREQAAWPLQAHDYPSNTTPSGFRPDGLVIAGGTHWSGTKSVLIKQEVDSELTENKKRLYCYGLIRYRDVFR